MDGAHTTIRFENRRQLHTRLHIEGTTSIKYCTARSASTYWQSTALCLLSSEQKKNLPLNSCTPMTAKINWNSMYTMRIFTTFFSELTTQSNTAFSFGTRLIVFSGRNTRSTRSDLIVDKFCPTLPFSPPLYSCWKVNQLATNL